MKIEHFVVGLLLGGIVVMFFATISVVSDQFFLIDKSEIVKRGYGYYNFDKEFMIKDEYKKYYEMEE